MSSSLTEMCQSRNKNCLSVLHLNINRLGNKILHLETLLEVDLKVKPFFICITESWLRKKKR